ncbi:HypC/HybG/HupF family hydrogenase formation chaperone [Roseibium sp. HPY-6]|uniref:HypC/HybG/HupF family hydrogenase formation chaperone n=1 Tax=Roseibium sp. HPY-6 TaxID=3229852 RepID=UPI00338FEB4B
MCLGIPMQLFAIHGIAGHVSRGSHQELVDLSLTPDAVVGDWVLTFLGAAREIISADEAAKISAALEGLSAVMNGGSAGNAFADLEETEPSLPSHLQAALDAGRTTA